MRSSKQLRSWRSFLGLAALGVLAAAGPASATPVYYGELLTATGVGNLRASLTSTDDFGSPVSILGIRGTDFEWGAGLGDTRVSAAAPLTITHTFAPEGYAVDSVERAIVTVSVIDDHDFARESGELLLEGDVLASGQATLNFFDGDVTAFIESIGDTVSLTVRAVRGDFFVAFSGLAVAFEGSLPTRAPAIPEPGAALAFAMGLVVVARRRRA